MTSVTKIVGTGSDDNAVGTITWSNPTNIQADDGSEADAFVNTPGAQQTHYLKGLMNGNVFAIPSSSTINGVQVIIEKKRVGGGIGFNLKDVVVSLVKGGSVTGNNYADTTNNWPTTAADTTYGTGTTDMWGLTLSPSDVNAVNFGVVISATLTKSGAQISIQGLVDKISITIYYTEAAGTNFQINIGDSWKVVSAAKINIGDSWKSVASAKINIGDSWQTIF